ncbi:MAG TPA: carboxypeptidase-like regulatory domain-containing protein [Bryobacteraceae bacterium]
MSSLIKYVLLGSILLLLASIPLARQSDSGRLEGVVTSESGLVATASVELRNVLTGRVVYCDTNENGLYSFEDLRGALLRSGCRRWAMIRYRFRKCSWKKGRARMFD